jgi:hypothetical protein
VLEEQDENAAIPPVEILGHGPLEINPGGDPVSNVWAETIAVGRQSQLAVGRSTTRHASA